MLRRQLAALCALIFAGVLPGRAELSFQNVVIDATNPKDPHCKTLGDIDGDGQLDALAASSSGGGMFWYEYPAWTQRTIRATGSWTTDMQVGDVDDDGDLDVVIPDGAALKWYENPRPVGDPRTDTWVEHVIGTAGADNHDVEVGDIEPDGDLDVVTRRKSGGVTYLWRQGPAGGWSQVTVSSQDGEGTSLGDLDGDGDLDVAQNGFWVEQVSPTSWTSHTIDAGWPNDSGALVIDVDGNGTQDVVLSPSEGTGRLSWYSAIDPVAGPWVEHPIDPTVSYLHTFKAADMDFDGDLDLVTAEMHQSSGADEVSIYFNVDAVAWQQQIVAESGSHNLRVGDIGGDGDVDIFGANWNDSAPNSAVIEMWENTSSPLPLSDWRRHIVETSLPWNAVFVDGRDLDGDGLPDLAAGGWWYPNPGFLGGVWSRQSFGAPLHNMAAIHDFDNDGDLDVLGTNGQVGGEDFSWARNDGSGGFTSFDITNVATGGDFLQGVSVYQLLSGGQEEVVISWHNGGAGAAMGTAILSVPDDPTTAAWPLTVLSATTNQEEVPVGDVDRDGDVDVHLGTTWLRQDPGAVFSVQSGISLSGGGVPDRVQLADIDDDGDLDVVIGVEFGSALVWGENDGSGGGWTEHVISNDFDFFSIDVADLDGDGDLDVVGGAHQGAGEVSVYENDGTGLGWTERVVDPGDSPLIDHHDGTRLVDMDLDGDLDVVSVGWTKRSLVIYENLALDGGGGGGDTTPPELLSAAAPGDATEVVVDFSEPLLAASAGNVASYGIDGGVVVSDAALAANQRTVILTTSTLSAGTPYTLTVDNVADLAGNPIAAGSTASFELGLADPSAGLVAFWPFEAGSGNVALDVSGNGHHGFLSGGVQWSGGPALSFGGVDGHLEAGTFDVPGNELTLSAWLWADDLANCSSSDCRLLSKATGTAEGDHYFMLSTIASGGETRLRFRLKAGGSTTTLIAGSGALVAGRWTHAAAVYDGSTMELFLDGVSVGSTAKTGALNQNPSVPVWIGGNPPDASGKPWSGRLDDVRIYDRALSPAELAALPPASAESIFTDGFESGNLAAWNGGATGGAGALAAAAWSGIRGLRVEAGSSCAGPDVVNIGPPETTVQGTTEACLEIWAEGVTVVAPGATLRAGEKVVLGEGFSTEADLTVDLDGALTPVGSVRDLRPLAETSYVADYHLRADALDLTAGDRLEHLVASAGAEGVSFRLVLQSDGGGGIQALLEARRDDGSFAVTPAGQEATLAPGWRHLRIVWTAGAGSGALTLTVDGAVAVSLSGLVNGSRRVDTVDLGVVGGTLDGAGGFLDIDSFASWN